MTVTKMLLLLFIIIIICVKRRAHNKSIQLDTTRIRIVSEDCARALHNCVDSSLAAAWMRWKETPAHEKNRGFFFLMTRLCYAQFMDVDADDIVNRYPGHVLYTLQCRRSCGDAGRFYFGFSCLLLF